MGRVRHRPFEHRDEGEGRSGEERAAERDRAVAAVAVVALRESSPQADSEEEEEERDQRRDQERDDLMLARSSCQYANVSAGPVSLLGSFQSRTRPTKNKRPASTPAIGRKRSNRSELKAGSSL